MIRHTKTARARERERENARVHERERERKRDGYRVSRAFITRAEVRVPQVEYITLQNDR